MSCLPLNKYARASRDECATISAAGSIDLHRVSVSLKPVDLRHLRERWMVRHVADKVGRSGPDCAASITAAGIKAGMHIPTLTRQVTRERFSDKVPCYGIETENDTGSQLLARD